MELFEGVLDIIRHEQEFQQEYSTQEVPLGDSEISEYEDSKGRQVVTITRSDGQSVRITVEKR